MTSATMSAVGRPKREAMFASSLSIVCAGASERGGGSMWSTAPAWRDVFGRIMRPCLLRTASPLLPTVTTVLRAVRE